MKDDVIDAGNDKEVLFPDLKICDCHHHFLNSPDFKYSPDDLIRDISRGHNIVSTVYIECKSGYYRNGVESLRPVGETENVERLISNCKNPQNVNLAAGIVGFADLKLGDSVIPVLEAHKAASKRFRGIRNISAWHDSSDFPKGPNDALHAGLLLDTAFRKGFTYLKRYDLSFDATLFHTQLAELIDLARTFPETIIIIDHLGIPLGVGPYASKKEEVFSVWKQHIAELSKLENVFLKIGGVGIESCPYGLKDQPQPIRMAAVAQGIRRYCLWGIEKLGVKRCMFESNFPVDGRLLSYGIIWNTFKLITSDFTPEERQSLFHDTAVTAYRIGATN